MAEQSKGKLTEIIKNYIAAKTAVQQKTSTKADIEHMLSFVQEDVQVEHKPHKELKCENPGDGKVRFREGLSYYLGKYESSKTEIIDITEGKNVVAIKFRETIEIEWQGKMETDVSNALYIFEFKDGLISREFRYDL